MLGVCIGVSNHKPFILLVGYGFIAALVLVIGCFPEALERVRSVFSKKGKVTLSVGTVVWFQMYYVQYCMAVALGGLLTFHLYLVAMGRTVLEACILNNFRDCFPPWKAASFEHDRGVRRNFEEVFGSGLEIFLPVVDDTWVKRLDAQSAAPP